ncbi:hypothetical protein HNP46_006523 [Pseudomonas nitritireducens]|uniref:DUF4352 domain-containing protein n=1 Tax=Pseudomonas nitroreducens TaxID=46680 RepID=A0A7W7KS58_PSENT|nr:hypothetical protein [Pseudomonas nitritireducens]MBB4867609.1 hypothetical protein [Pseudomonas nitritireducens]
MKHLLLGISVLVGIVSQQAFADPSQAECAAIVSGLPKGDQAISRFRDAALKYTVIGLSAGQQEPIRKQTNDPVERAFFDKLNTLLDEKYRNVVLWEQDDAETAFKHRIEDLMASSSSYTPDRVSGISACYLKGLNDSQSEQSAKALAILDALIATAKDRVAKGTQYEATDAYKAEVKSLEKKQAEQQARAAQAEAAAKRERENPTSSSAQVGDIKVTANSCRMVSSLGIVAEPQHQDGTKFLVLDATYENVATTSRMVYPGSLNVKLNGKTYKFSSVEMVISQDYVLPPTGLNPLVKYRSKLAYRVPENLSGKVTWTPGDNPKGVSVACGSI